MVHNSMMIKTQGQNNKNNQGELITFLKHQIVMTIINKKINLKLTGMFPCNVFRKTCRSLEDDV